MKKNICFLILLMIGSHVMANEIPARYVKEIQKISDQYGLEMKRFLRALDPNIERFDPHQEQEFCMILQRYADNFHQTNEQYRKNLPLSYTALSKKEIVNQVKNSKEMQLLNHYDIECNLTDQ